MTQAVELLAANRLGESSENHEDGSSCDPFFGHEWCLGWARMVLSDKSDFGKYVAALEDVRKFVDEQGTLKSMRIGEGLKPCPFCGDTRVWIDKMLRDGYEQFKDDEDAYAYSIRCGSCAASGGWSKSSENSAIRLWNMRVGE
jgi:Lar family restriction alleviation protein